MDADRLANRKVDGPNVTLAYMADDKTHVRISFEDNMVAHSELQQKAPVEALLRSLLLVFMDNATAEYTFIKSFFSAEKSIPSQDSLNAIFSPNALLSPEERQSVSGSDYGGRSRSNSVTIPSSPSTTTLAGKDEQATLDAIWKQVLDPVMEYVQVS
jgi:hypothetical protein